MYQPHRPLRLTALIVTLLATAGASRARAEAPPGGPVTLWQIGQEGDGTADFALGESDRYAAYLERFPGAVRFAVGSSDPARDFPYIHPGPMDQWAGARAHEFTIAFELDEEPSGAFLFLAHIARSHYAYPPVLRVTLNGTSIGQIVTEPDGHRQDRYLPLPASALRRGANELRIENPDGSWAQYDALALRRFPPEVPVREIAGFRLLDSLFIREIDGKPHQTLRVRIDGFWDGTGVLRVSGPSLSRDFPVRDVALGEGLYELPIPIPSGPESWSCALLLDGAVVAESAVETRPHRRWTLYAALKTHYDLGYTHPVDVMLATAAGPMLDRILEHCEATRDFPEDTRFRWTYPTWVLEKIRELLPEGGKTRLDTAIRRGDITWNAAPFTLHSYFCGIEDMVRAFYPSARLEDAYGKRVRWAKQTDVPGHTRFLPQVLAGSGIRLLQIGANFGVRGEKAPPLFWWESPDGSRVLTQLTDGYGHGFDEQRLLALERDPAYPYDVFLAMYVTGDNVGPANLIDVATLAKSMAERYLSPRIRIGPVEEFVDAIEARFAGQVPVLRAELTDWWIHGVASMAREVSLARLARERLPAAEKAWSLARLLGSARPTPRAAIAEGYAQSLLFSEHTWGMAGFKPAPQPPERRDLATNESEAYREMRRSWEVKGDEARAAWRIADQAAAEGLDALAEALELPPGALLLFNPLNWPRSDLVRVPLAELGGIPDSVRDAANGAEIAWQLDGDEVVFLAKEVPPLGFRALIIERLAPESAAGASFSATSGSVIENARYRIAIDAAAGALASIVDLESGRELVDPDAPFRLGQYVYEGMSKIEGVGWHGSPYEGPGTGRVVPRIDRVRVEEGPVFSRLVAECSLRIEGFPYEIGSVERVVQTFTLPRDLDWIGCEVALSGKRPTALAEQGNVAFPFLVEGGQIRLELLGSVVDPEADLQELGNHDAFAVQHWIDISGPRGGVTWSPIDTTIVTLGDTRLFRWDPAYVPRNTTLYANVLNNGWSTNFQEWQGGDFRFRFRLRAHEGDWVAGRAARFGREAAQPLLARVVRAAAGAPAAASSGARRQGSPAEGPVLVAARDAVLVNLKEAEDGDGWIARLYNPSPSEETVRIALSGRRMRSAERVLLNERPLAAQDGPQPGGVKTWPAVGTSGGIEVRIGPFALETIRLRL